MMKNKPARYLTLPNDCLQVVPKNGDELYPNGIFVFNITALLDNIATHPEEFLPIRYDITSLYESNCKLHPTHVEMSDISRPIIVAEISPDSAAYYSSMISEPLTHRGYNLIDGHHRVEKARQCGLTELPAYVLQMEQILPFMCEGREQYVHYWNSKLVSLERDKVRV